MASQPKMATFYEFRMLNLPSRYQLSAKAQTVLKAHDDYKTSQISEAELGRLLRLSTDNRNAIVQTMVKLSEIMANKPEEAKHCVAIIKTCGEIITIADKPVQTTGFPYFFKLPPEVRNRIYGYYIKTGEKAQTLVPHPKKPGGCFCAPHEAPSWRAFERKPVAALRANRQLRDEIFAALYKRYVRHIDSRRQSACANRNHRPSTTRAHVRWLVALQTTSSSETTFAASSSTGVAPNQIQPLRNSKIVRISRH